MRKNAFHNIRSCCLAAGALTALSIVASAEVKDGRFLWGGRDEHPAVVNPVVRADDGNVISLRGEWEFSSQRMKVPWRNGSWDHYYKMKWDDARMISVPGCWEAQGVGETGNGESWDAKWDHNAKPIRHKHMGDGWYRRSVDIPAAWKGKRVWLKVGGVKSKGWFYVNDVPVAHVDNYCGTCKYEITDLVEPGKPARVVAQANNVVPSRKGLMSAMHKWGGIYRDVELEATPQTFIDDAWVRGLFDEKVAEAHVSVACGDGSKCKIENVKCKMKDYVLRFTVDGQTVERSILQSCTSTNSPFSTLNFTFAVPLPELRPW